MDAFAEEEELLAGEETYDRNSSSEEDGEEVRMEVDKDSLLEDDFVGDDLFGKDLFRCGSCSFSSAGAAGFRTHLAICGASTGEHLLSCRHCGRRVKLANTLVEHLVRAHGPRRYSCSLCLSAKASTPQGLRGHLRTEHRVTHCRALPADPAHADPEADRFVLVPRNAVARHHSSATSSSKAGVKDTFSPLEVDMLPHNSMSRLVAQSPTIV